MFNKVKSLLTGKVKGIIWRDEHSEEIPKALAGNPFLPHIKSDSYDNAFPDIARIAEAFAEVMPFAIDENGNKLPEQPQLMRALYNPNEEMSVSDFLETLITMLLVHPLVHILVWHYEGGKPIPGGPITPENVAGFTFLENAAVSRYDGKTTFRSGEKTFTKSDVITLSLNVNPYCLSAGYSPSRAIKKWATVDDYIAEYQASQFGNGGVPAGLMTVTAQSVEAYNEAVDRLIAAHTGPSNANRIVYTHRPTSTIDGKPMAAGVEWTPFAQTNKDLTLDALFNQANKKIDMNFGVPEEVKGYLQNSNYASAEVADYVFARRILYPKLVKVYSKFTHEMNRVTGGLRFAVSFDYDLPVLTDTRKVQAETLVSMINAGFTVESAVEALQLPRSYLKLATHINTQDENLQVEDAVAAKPSQDETSKSVAKCGHSHCRHRKSDDSSDIIDPDLKTLLEIYLNIILSILKKLLDGMSLSEAIPTTLNALASDQSASVIRTVIICVVYYHLAIKESEFAKEYASRLQLKNPVSTLGNEVLAQFKAAIDAALLEIQTRNANGDTLSDLDISALQDTRRSITSALISAGIYASIPDFADGNDYEQQLDYLLREFARNNLEVWGKSVDETANVADIVVAIEQAMANGAWRVNRWALTEQHRAEELGKLLAAEKASEVAEVEPYKIWRTRSGACASCAALEGETVRADLEFSNGNMVPADHPNCRCYFDVEFKPLQKSIKVTCPHCKRYMFESSGGTVKNVICANSKCKRHYDITVKNGEIDAKERGN